MKSKIAAVFTALALSASLAGAAQAQAETQPITVIAIAKVKPGTEAVFQKAVFKILAPTRAEAGNIRYVYHQAKDASNEFAFVELWKSQQALDEHLQTPHMQSFFEEVKEIFEQGYPTITQYLQVQE